ncbi:MAG: hypothetical protein NW214_00140 [Pseudanabaenaceae cyanobacterium bins.39]|nr:hypothetical protein [Pseudanabaenaceae cyanobacterium bins.39]
MIVSLEKRSRSPLLTQRYDATWDDYVAVRDNSDINCRKIAFHQAWLLVDMGTEGLGHSSSSDLMTAIFFVWAFLNPDVMIQSYGHCLIDLSETHACAPDLVLYRFGAVQR